MSYCVYKMINSSKIISFSEGLNILEVPNTSILSVDEETCLIDEETKVDYCCNITYQWEILLLSAV